MNRMYINLILSLALGILAGCASNLDQPENFDDIPPENALQENDSVSTPLPPLQPLAKTYPIRLAWFYKPPENGTLPTIAEHFDLFVLTHRDEEERDALRTLGVNETIYQYLLFIQIMDPGSCTERPFGNQVAYKPGDFCQISADHPDWFLRDESGNLIRRGSNVYMDPASDGYRAFWLERVIEMQSQYEWDGLFIDNVEASLDKIKRMGVTPEAYQDETVYQNEIKEFLEFLHANYFNPQNKPVLANIIELKNNQVWFQYLQYLDGAMIEAFSVGYNNRNLSITEWKQQMELAIQSQSIGKTLILVAQGDENDLNRQKFALASYLLINSGRAHFRYTNSDQYENIWLYDNYGFELGEPLAPAYKTGLKWKRDFEHGYVIVDPLLHKAEIVITQ